MVFPSSVYSSDISTTRPKVRISPPAALLSGDTAASIGDCIEEAITARESDLRTSVASQGPMPGESPVVSTVSRETTMLMVI